MKNVSSERVYRHKKRGTEYVLIGIGKMQSDNWQVSRNGFDASIDMEEVAIYRSTTDPTEIWVRPREEFEDGRFEALPGAAPAVSSERVSGERLEEINAECIQTEEVGISHWPYKGDGVSFATIKAITSELLALRSSVKTEGPAAASEVTDEMVERLFTEMDRRMGLPKHIHQEPNSEWLPVDDTQIGVEFAVEFITAALKGDRS